MSSTHPVLLRHAGSAFAIAAIMIATSAACAQAQTGPPSRFAATTTPDGGAVAADSPDHPVLVEAAKALPVDPPSPERASSDRASSNRAPADRASSDGAFSDRAFSDRASAGRATGDPTRTDRPFAALLNAAHTGLSTSTPVDRDGWDFRAAIAAGLAYQPRGLGIVPDGPVVRGLGHTGTNSRWCAIGCDGGEKVTQGGFSLGTGRTSPDAPVGVIELAPTSEFVAAPAFSSSAFDGARYNASLTALTAAGVFLLGVLAVWASNRHRRAERGV